MRQSQCDRHKVKMIDVVGPFRSFMTIVANGGFEPLMSNQFVSFYLKPISALLTYGVASPLYLVCPWSPWRPT